MKKRIKYIINLCYTLCISAFLYAQDDFQSLSPEVASITRYGTYSANNYTGNIDISVPLYTIKEGDFMMPISLKYDASGFLVNKNAGIAGQNFTLLCGGMITRIVRSIPDEKKVYTTRLFFNGYWYGIKNSTFPPKTQANLLNPANYISTSTGNFDYIDSEYQYEHDPDLFTVNVGSDYFQFMIDNEGNPVVFGARNIHIDMSRYTTQAQENLTLLIMATSFINTPITLLIPILQSYQIVPYIFLLENYSILKISEHN